MFTILQMASDSEVIIIMTFLGLFILAIMFSVDKQFFDSNEEIIKSEEEQIQDFLNGPYGKTGDKFKSSVNQLAYEIPKCSKCRMSQFQFWLFTPETVEFSCLTCKKKSQYYQEDLNTNLGELYQLWEDYHYNCYAWTVNNHPDIKGKVPAMYQWSTDMGGLVQVRNGQKSYVKIVINVKGENKQKERNELN